MVEESVLVSEAEADANLQSVTSFKNINYSITSTEILADSRIMSTAETEIFQKQPELC